MNKSEKVLITGATGFIGSHLTELMIQKGYEVVAFDRYNSNNNWGWLETVKHKYDLQVVLGDIRDYDSVNKAMDGCVGVMHLAALIGIPYSYISPLAYLRTNVEGTYNVLESAKNLGLEQVLITSTSETYGTAQYTPIDENHPLVGQSPYSATKIASDQLSVSYFRSFELPVKIVRPFNTYGPRQSARAIIPSVIAQILEGNLKLKVGNLSPKRDLTFVTDTVSGFESIYRCDKLFGEFVNIGMNQEISIKELIDKISNILEVKLEIEQERSRVRPLKSEVGQLVCNNQKLIKNTDWEPRFDLENGLKETIMWMKSNLHNYKNEDYAV